jgi:regulator of protease activity HflC (stomatin/prohibitin superfamily)
MTFSASPHFTGATRSRSAVLLVGIILATIGSVLASAAGSQFTGVPSAMGYLAASLFVAAAGLISAGMVVHGRLAAIGDKVRAENTPQGGADGADAGSPVKWANRLVSRLTHFRVTSGWLAGWPHVLASTVLAAIAMGVVITAWQADDQKMLSPLMQQVFGGLVILFAFPLLLLERTYANSAVEALPEAPQIERVLRVPLITFVGLGTTSVLASVGLEWPAVIERVIAILIGLVSLELVLRGVAMLFLPWAAIDTRRSVADSTIASLLRPRPPSFAAVGTAVRRRFGIDLSRSWALAFVRGAAVPIGFGMAAFAWCITGVTALGLNERAVYERLGEPVAVFGPGLHVHLPWPLGIMHRLELGVVHEIPIVFSPPGEQGTRRTTIGQVASKADIEGIAPASADRLWNRPHPSEASYLIASESQGKQSFQIVNIDLQVVYRVGLSEQAAKDASYAVADPEALIRAIAGQLLVRYFGRNTLLNVLVQDRERFTNEFRAELQERLQELSTGVDVIAVVVEAIHPSPDAASAYHYVQAAEILAKSQISLRRADAIAKVKSAEQTATGDRNNALATAVELDDRAGAESVLFNGDRQAYHQDGQVFLFERRLDRLSTSLPKSNFIVIDSRLEGATAPTIDLRRFDLPGAAYQPNADEPSTRLPPGSHSKNEGD